MELYIGQRLPIFKILEGEINPENAIGIYSHADFFQICGKVQFYKQENLKLIGFTTVKSLKPISR